MKDTLAASPADFWESSGHVLLDHGDDGYLRPTDEFWKAYLARPEIVPPPEACLVERAIYQRLLREPLGVVPRDEIKSISDRDAQENWRYFIAFRDHLQKAGAIEAGYNSLFREDRVSTPALFLNQMVHLILRNVLDGERDAFKLRAAEMLFRPQRLSIRDGVPLLADDEVVGDASVPDHHSPLVAVFADARSRDLDVLTSDNAQSYFGRSDAFDMVLDFRFGGAGRTALARVLEQWTRHMTGAEVAIEPIDRVDGDWRWFVGLDADGTQIGNALWRGEEPPDQGRERIVALYRLEFLDPGDMQEGVRGAPVYLILGMSPNRLVRLKPQNLLTGLPLKTNDRLVLI